MLQIGHASSERRAQKGKDVDTEVILKFVIPLFTGGIALLLQVPGVRKTWDEVKYLRRDRRKREAEFATKFFDQCGDPHVKRYAEQLGYAALVGDNHLSLEQRRFLLSLDDPERGIDLYLRTFRWVQIYVNHRRVGWKRKRHELRAYRNVARMGYLFAYAGWAYFAGAPILFRDLYDPQQKIGLGVLSALVVYCMGVGIPLAFLCLRRFFILKDAERLIVATSPPVMRPKPRHSTLKMQMVALLFARFVHCYLSRKTMAEMRNVPVGENIEQVGKGGEAMKALDNERQLSV